MDNEYIELFELIEDIVEEQESQKLRGLNDYNMVNVVRKASHEVGMHSNVIFSLINLHGLHYQKDLFLNLFIEKVLGFTLKDFGTVFDVQAEEITDKNRRIDFTIKSENYFIGIEMKVNANDLVNQIFHYDEYLTKKANGQKVNMFYLTKDGKDAPLRSKGNVEIKKISFEKHILEWLSASQKEVKHITNLNVAFEDYKNIVKKITGKYKGNIVSIEEKLIKSKRHLKTALILDREMIEIKGTVLWNFFEEIKNLDKQFDDITDKIELKERIVDESKCREVFSKSQNKPEFFGIFFDCNFGDNLYFHIEYGKGSIFYGIVKLIKNKNGLYTLESLEEKDIKRFKQSLKTRNIEEKSYKKTSPSRYWVEIGDIWNLDNENILNFSQSDLKSNLLGIIKDIQKIKP